MQNEIENEVNELIDFCGGVPAAVAMLSERIERRAAEGKPAAKAERQLECLNAL